MIGPAPPLVLGQNDWSTSVGYWSSDRPYRAYIPSNLGNNDNFPAGHWVSNWGVNHHQRWILKLDMRKIIFRIREDAEKIIRVIISTFELKCTLPSRLSLRWLEDAFTTEEALASKVAEARYHILEQYGFIAFHIKKRPDWMTRPELSTVKDLIIHADLAECRYRGCIGDFKTLEFEELVMLIEHRVPIHYQWFLTDTGPFDPRTLKANDYDELRSPSRQSPPPEEHRVVALPALGEGTFYRVSSNGDRTIISRKEYRRWAYWCQTKREQLSSGEVFLLFQDTSDDSAQATMTDMDMAAHHVESSPNEGELSPAHVLEEHTFIPDQDTHETPPTAVGVCPLSAPEVLDDVRSMDRDQNVDIVSSASIPQPLYQLQVLMFSCET
ncbi:hypothetical protein BDR07DRAFT_1494635 [Suillus spraguei]|nr:hypothetical protein BDR07DRAFT_1494635 [Suillus spraguei]